MRYRVGFVGAECQQRPCNGVRLVIRASRVDNWVRLTGRWPQNYLLLRFSGNLRRSLKYWLKNYGEKPQSFLARLLVTCP